MTLLGATDTGEEAFRAVRAGTGIRVGKLGLVEKEASITSKLSRGTFAATFFLAVVAALELEGVQIGDV